MRKMHKNFLQKNEKKNLIFIHVAFMYISSTGYGQPR